MPANPAPARPPVGPLIGEVIAIGDELTTGQRLDTNTQWLSQRLTEAGVHVLYHTTVADDLAANVAVFRAAAERADVVVATGGLGPTADDLTRDAMAEAAGVALFERADLAAHIEGLFAARGRVMPPQNLRQAQLPEGARAINNPGGSAPGVDQTVGRCRLFALPGVPAEMHDMWAATVATEIAALVGPRRVACHWLVKCFGAGESRVESLVPDLIARGREPLVGITASHATITLRVTASGVDEEACYSAMAPTLEEIRTKLGDLVFAEQPGGEAEIELQDVVVDLLRERGKTVATHELMTQGLLARWLAAADRDANVFRGGYVAGAGADLATSLNADYQLFVASSAEGTIPIALQTSGGRIEKEITPIGHASIHLPLVAKHALNLLRLDLLGKA